MKKEKQFNLFFLAIFLLLFISCTEKKMAESSEELVLRAPEETSVIRYLKAEPKEETPLYESEETHQEAKIIVNGENIKSLSLQEILINVPWILGEYAGSMNDTLKFSADNTYSLRDFYGLGEFLFGNYEIIDNNKVLLKYPFEVYSEEYAQEQVKKMFFDGDDLVLEFDREYVDFYFTGKLFSNMSQVYFRSAASPPQGAEYELDNTVVIKRSGTVKVMDVLNTRREPSVDSQLTTIQIFERFDQMFDNMRKYFYNPYPSISLVFPGETFRYDAVTKEIDNIDGFSKPWYHIIIQLDHHVVYTWVYGGYVEEITDDERWSSYIDRDILIQELIDRGYIDENKYAVH